MILVAANKGLTGPSGLYGRSLGTFIYIYEFLIKEAILERGYKGELFIGALLTLA